MSTTVRSLATMHRRLLASLAKATALEGRAEKAAKAAAAKPSAAAITRAKAAAERAKEAREVCAVLAEHAHRADSEWRQRLGHSATSTAAVLRGAEGARPTPKAAPKATKKAPKAKK